MIKALVAGIVAVVVLLAGMTWLTLHWTYSDGERAGYVQKLSRKGWLCKTWEGEMAMVTMPGTVSDKFYFTVPDDAVASQINTSVEYGDGFLERLQFPGQVDVGRQNFTELDECSDDIDGHLYGPRTIQHRRSHDGAMLGEEDRQASWISMLP